MIDGGRGSDGSRLCVWVCVYARILVIKLFSALCFVSLLMGNKLSLGIEAKYSPVKHFSSCGGGFGVLNIYKFMSTRLPTPMASNFLVWSKEIGNGSDASVWFLFITINFVIFLYSWRKRGPYRLLLSDPPAFGVLFAESIRELFFSLPSNRLLLASKLFSRALTHSPRSARFASHTNIVGVENYRNFKREINENHRAPFAGICVKWSRRWL